MSTMSRIDALIDEVVDIAIGSTEDWIADGEAVDDISAFIGVEVAMVVLDNEVDIPADDRPYVIGHAIARALVEAKLLGLGATPGNPLFQPIQL